MTKKKQSEHTEVEDGEIVEPKEAPEGTKPVDASHSEAGTAKDGDKAQDGAKAEEYLNDLKRLQADFENYKKRQNEAEKSLKGYLIQGLILDIIPVLDNFQAATNHVPEADKSSPWVVGIQYIEKQLETVLVEHGVTLIEPGIGETFDPSKHEAIEKETEESEPLEDGDEIKDIISQVRQKGYQLGDKVIRAAKVTIR
jgi:molecular chaperone GrpE